MIEDNIKGEIIAITGHIITLSTEDDFELEFNVNEVVPLMSSAPISFKGGHQKQEQYAKELSLKKKRNTTAKRAKTIPPMEVDLHIEKLVKNYKRLATHEILELQLDRAKRSLDLAIQKRIPKLVLIHGVGQGVLKAELDFLIGRYEGIRSEAADYQKYGQGATLIHISQKASRW